MSLIKLFFYVFFSFIAANAFAEQNHNQPVIAYGNYQFDHTYSQVALMGVKCAHSRGIISILLKQRALKQEYKKQTTKPKY